MDKKEDATETQNQPKKKPFYKKTLGCLFTLIGGLFLFLIFLLVIGLWLGGRLAPTIASGIVKDKAGAELTVGENNINLFAGRVDLKDITLTNPARFRNKDFVDINQIKAEVSLLSFLTDTYHIKDIVLDIKAVTFVGKGKSALEYGSDNNILDFKNAFTAKETAPKTTEPEKKTETPKTETESKPTHFKIDRLVIKLNQLRAIIGDSSNNEGELIPAMSDVFEIEFTDVTDENIKEKVYDKIGALLHAKNIDAAITGVLNTVSNEATAQANKVAEKANEAVTKAGEKASETLNKVGEGLSGLLGGNKKEEKK